MRSLRKILLIEDNLVAQFAAKQLLVHAGFNVDAACDGKDGIHLYRYYHYDMVILDIGLPDMSGFEVAKKIRKLEQEQHKPPVEIVALTAMADQYPAIQYQQSGIDRIFGKPLQDEMIQPIFKDKNL
jgi:CheY-like chemotaxis protein